MFDESGDDDARRVRMHPVWLWTDDGAVHNWAASPGVFTAVRVFPEQIAAIEGELGNRLVKIATDTEDNVIWTRPDE